MKNLKKIVTYSGSVSYEAVSIGLKPIIISSNALYKYNNDFVHKPKDLDVYRQLILSNNYKIFKVKKSSAQQAKKMIFLNERIMTLKKNLKSISVYRTEKHKKILDYKLVNESIKSNIGFLKDLGLLLSKGLTHTVSKEGIKFIN